MSRCIKEIGEGFSLWYEVESFSYGILYENEPSTATQLLSWLSTKDITVEKCFVNVDWLLTSACNLCCPYCIAADINGVVPLSRLELLLGNLIQRHPLHVTLSGGEPTLSSHLRYAIEHLPEDIACTIDTNGTHPEIVSNIIPRLHMKPVNVRVTIDSMSYEIAETTRPSRNGKRYLDLVFDTIKLLQSARIPVMVHTTVTSVNINHLNDVADYLDRCRILKWKLYRVDVRKEEISNWTVNKEEFLSQVSKLKLAHPNIDIDYDYEPMGESVVIISPNGMWLTEDAEMLHRVVLLDPKCDKDPCWERINVSKHIRQYLK